jgi:hypothetical protein
VLRAEHSVKQPLRAECGGKERFELTGQGPWYVAQTLEKLPEAQARPFSAISQDGSVPATVEKCDRAGLSWPHFRELQQESLALNQRKLGVGRLQARLPAV